jgi:hypothetical protein
VCFVVRKTISQLEHAILTTLFLLVQKTPTRPDTDFNKTYSPVMNEITFRYLNPVWMGEMFLILARIRTKQQKLGNVSP